MTDRELLELAAKAAGYKFTTDGVNKRREKDGIAALWIDSPMMTGWNPLENDGYALRLAVKLQIDICHNHAADHQKWVLAERAGCESAFPPACCVEDEFEEPQRMAATRRAIVRAAAEIGRNM